MRIYIASSWKNQHGVEMLTAILRNDGHEVVSWIENSYGEKLHEGYESMRKWIHSENGEKAFKFDTGGALDCDLLILYTYAGSDAHAELALAWSRGIPVYGLYQKGYEFGLMSKMVSSWYDRYTDLVDAVKWMNEAFHSKSRAADEAIS